MKDDIGAYLTVEIEKNLKAWSKALTEEIENEARNVAEEGKQKLRSVRTPSASSAGGNINPTRKRRAWSEYSKGWSVRKQSKTGYISYRIHNKDHYRLTHLLEYGHATVNGGRTRAFEHIKPVNEFVKEEFEKRVENAIRKASGK